MRSDFETERAANIQLRKRNGATVIHLSGHIDESAADALNAELERLLEDGVSRIVFELSEVKFMGSSGLGQVMRASPSTSSQEPRSALSAPQRRSATEARPSRSRKM
ncbi:MAG: STAS domain-containing protein [Verrucomicrobiota bacterium]